MIPLRRSLIAVALLACLFSSSCDRPQEAVVTPRAREMTRVLESMDVPSRWIAGQHVDWQSGLPDGVPMRSAGRHTHCSAFVAAAAQRLGVYILRPPEHSQKLLANAQNEWLAEEGAAAGWKRLDGPAEAQDAANRGLLVVASYRSHRASKPGHIAVIRPAERSAYETALFGPDVIQAGAVNSNSINIRRAFAGHPSAWRDNEIDYYAHPVHLGETGGDR
ncbi:hypothetical protein [Methylocystis bryophila]|uniref:Peptidase C51 domain-containing protein n=1 Tax=Methylocystis bryophila TaxID=655015 RepID=A0A1W6MRG2_9HYPH|nr:hypothetical protein [Methylocystis bryophila]ARN80184.1 hypothetical protein B1812_02765 [Methylocystis bryophila]BDV40130.1 hypothetical protein DSM21852_33830 [Methylocystis bryophila]